MLHVIYLFFLAILNSIDNMGIGVAYSIGRVKIPLLKNLLISFMAFLVSFISALSGSAISRLLSEDVSTIISMLLLIVMGIWMIYESFKGSEEEKLKDVRIIGYKESITIGIILAIDDVGISVSSGLVGYGPFMVSLPFFVVSFIIFFLANYGTNFLSKFNIGKKATVIAGALMILMGILRYFD